MLSPARLALLAASACLFGIAALGGRDQQPADRFAQLGNLLPSPSPQRAASGAPGHEYWQQKVDYNIDVRLDDAEQRLLGSERIRYHNNSPDVLRYLWVALDPNIYAPTSHAVATSLAPGLDELSFKRMASLLERQTFDGSCEITAVKDATGADLVYIINDTMMRVDLPQSLEPGALVEFSIDWNYAINDTSKVRGRTGYEHFEEDGNYLYEIAQWFPRLCAYTDYTGWQNKQFLGRGEFTLEFGDYLVNITVPEDHVVASTGSLQNPSEVLKPAWIQRLKRAESSQEPLFIVTPEEAKANEASRASGTQTWTFQADNVRDFAFASSRKFIWDAVLHPLEGSEPVWAMSYYPNEGEPLWSRYSTHAVVHTLDVYSAHTFPYPYPVAISVNGPVGGMEYPMICFNGPRPEQDGSYSARTKYGLISVVIHEVGHNWFPMIVNSDERQWTFMDEGLNTFMQFLAEKTWEPDYPGRRGEPQDITEYMSSERQRPIMTNSESILQFGPNAYAKPATALNILRETVMGAELFDFAFAEYSRRWKFKRPEPADLFRTMEDASAVDLDWFWRGWFYTTDACDQSISGLTRYTIDTQNPSVEKLQAQAERDEEPQTLTQARYASAAMRSERFPSLLDFYNTYDALDVTPADKRKYKALLKKLEKDEQQLLRSELNFYVVGLEDLGGLAMPVILKVLYTDGSQEEVRVPSMVWRNNERQINKLLITEKEIASLVLDPHLETADIDLDNNYWPRRVAEKRIKLSPSKKDSNPMREALKEAKKAQQAAEKQAAKKTKAEAQGE